MNENYIEVKFEKYLAVEEKPYYLFSSKELFKEPFLVSCLDYPRKLAELMPEEKISICVKGIDKLDNKWLVNEISWEV